MLFHIYFLQRVLSVKSLYSSSVRIFLKNIVFDRFKTLMMFPFFLGKSDDDGKCFKSSRGMMPSGTISKKYKFNERMTSFSA